MNSVCANCQNKGMFIHELSIQYCTIVYPTRLCDKHKQPNPQGVSCSINCVLLTVACKLAPSEGGKKSGERSEPFSAK